MSGYIYLGLVCIFEATCMLHLYVGSCFPCNCFVDKGNKYVYTLQCELCRVEWSL